MDIQSQVKEIKQSFRQMMDGAVAQSMRNKGVDYKLNWGATLPRLREKADEIGKNYDLAIKHPSTCGSICPMPPRRPIHGWLPTRNSTNFVASIYSVVCL